MRFGFLIPLLLFFMIALLVGIYAGAGILVDNTKLQEKTALVKRTGESVPGLTAEAFFVGYVNSDGRVQELASSNADVILPIASITKLLSVPITEELLGGGDVTVRISESAANIPNSNHTTLKAGQSFLARDLIAVSFVESNNDAVTALAEQAGIDKVLTRMRERAAMIGMEGSVWVNATGLDPAPNVEPNSSSARSLANLGVWMAKEKPKLLAFTRETVVPLVDASGAFLRNATTTNTLLSTTDLPFTLLGGKTGETPRSGGNLLTLWRGPNNILLVVVILNADDRFTETRSLVEYLARAYTVRSE